MINQIVDAQLASAGYGGPRESRYAQYVVRIRDDEVAAILPHIELENGTRTPFMIDVYFRDLSKRDFRNHFRHHQKVRTRYLEVRVEKDSALYQYAVDRMPPETTRWATDVTVSATFHDARTWWIEVLDDTSFVDASDLLRDPSEDDVGLLDLELDARLRVVRAIAERRGQQAFRRELLKAYGQRCAFTGCDAVEALEAAHIQPYRGDHTNHVQNGVLLRADVHTLFDLGLIGVDTSNPDPAQWRVVLTSALKRTQYAALDGTAVHLPNKPEQRPNRAALHRHAARWRIMR